MKKYILTLIITAALFFAATQAAQGADWYVDNTATGLNNGTSWQDAWTNVDQIKGVTAGDTVYISGGPSGSSRTYYMTGRWKPKGGTSASRIIYQIGQDAAHNGVAIFEAVVPGNFVPPVGVNWITLAGDSGGSNLTISGDAGDGVMHFKLVGYSSALYGSGASNFRIAYIDASSGIGTGGDLFSSAFGSVKGVEIDHWDVVVNPGNADHFSYAKFVGSTWDEGGSIHHCTIRLPTLTNGYGADGLQWVGSGYSIHDNLIMGYVTTDYTGSQHQDGWQDTGGGSYVKIYNNVFVDISNYGLYADAYYGGFSHLRIYNNTVQRSHLGGGGIVLSTYANSLPWNDVVVANNTVAGYSAEGAQSITALIKGYNGNVSDYYVENNIIVNGWRLSLLRLDDSRITTRNNVTIAAADALTNFVSYTQYGGPNNDFHLKSTAASLINQGVGLSSYFTTDKDGISRPQGAAWDIGAYEYVPSFDLSADGAVTAYDAAMALQQGRAALEAAQIAGKAVGFIE